MYVCVYTEWAIKPKVYSIDLMSAEKVGKP